MLMPLNDFLKWKVLTFIVILFVGSMFINICQAETQTRVISSVGIKLFSLKDLKLQLNEFQTDCLNLLKNPLVSGAQIELIEVEGDRLSIRVSGKSPSSTKINFANEKWVFVPAEGETFEFQPKWEEQPISVDETGRFQFTVQIPELKKIRMSLEFKDKAVQSYFLEVDFISKRKLQGAVLRPYFTVDQRRRFCTKSRATAAFGATAFLYKQKLESFKGDLEYTTFELPSYSLGIDWARNPESDHSFWYRSAPGSISSSGAVSFKESYRWNILDYHYSYGRSSWIGEIGKALIYSRLRLGLQQHELPVTKLDSATKIGISPVNMTNATVGLSMKAYSDKHWMYEIQIGAQYPFSTSLDLQYQMMVDGGLGIFFSYWKDYFMGLQWYGHLHRFSYTREPGAFDQNGSVEFVYSSVEYSMGAVF